MKFWTYVLRCADCSFYVGQTDELERRLAQHEQGIIPGYTASRLPVKLVWAQDFATREEARSAEAQLKGWSRAKKLALIRGDWASVSALAKGRRGASTGSAKSGTFSADVLLHPHLSVIPCEPMSLQVRVRVNHERLIVRFRLSGFLDHIAVPAPEAAGRHDELWRHTCFELFALIDDGPGYLEFNFSPSMHWAAYCFASYRTRMNPLAIEPPRARCARSPYALELTAAVRIPDRFNATHLAFAAVIEESSGRKSYWALAHPAAKPDFHHPDSFVLALPEPQ